jgi:hypothetical protein
MESKHDTRPVTINSTERGEGAGATQHSVGGGEGDGPWSSGG